MKIFFTFVSIVFLSLTIPDLYAQPLNDNMGFATVVPHASNWCSPDAAYTTLGATPDGNAGSCWNTSPDYNVWFRFIATTSEITVTVDRGGTKGTLQRANVAIWESDGLTEVACNRYVYNGDDVSVGYTNLTVGNMYYISVDNNYSGYRGTFTLCIDNSADYDYYEGAIEVQHQANWCSADAAYTTVSATPDRNAASCWNTNPNYNRWFYFVATSPFVTVTVDRGGSKGTLQRANVAIWESDGLTEVSCKRYVYNGDDVSVGYTSLTAGNTYYISVDNNYSGYRGTFTLCLDNTVDYDYYEGAIEVFHQEDWCSADAAYTTVGATPDKNAASCWNTNPNYNRWFYFVATSPFVTVTVDRGGSKGTLQRANVAIWESDGLTEVSCKRYVYNGDDVSVGYTSLTAGNTYYISVDNNYSGYRGTFTLCLDNTVDYDYYEGAIEVFHQEDWCSADAAYTTVGATPDKNAASCWNTNPNYNRWFYFVATSPFVTVTVDRGGSKGTLQRANVAIWESDGLTEVSCKRYVYNGDDVSVGYTSLTAGNTYYISVDNNYSGYRGTFTLCLDNTVDYDYYEGAIEVFHQEDWCSADAAYTTVGATPDKNAASCWNTNPNYNRWFYFVATSPFVTVTVDRGGSKGTLQRANVAIWESDGLTEVSCKRYVYNGDDVSVGYTSLTAGNTYYISVDNNYSGYRGTFTLCLDNTVDYDYYEGAIEVFHQEDWCSADAAYTTVGATPDKNAASCWNTNPNYNRWFYFVATSPFVTVTVDRGGSKGTLQRANVAIWESDGLTEVSCKRYVYNGDDVSVGYTSLTAGNTYYISVDNNYSGYRGTFTLCLDNTVDYDYYEGAIEVFHQEDWCSADAAYTTVGATPDKNAASCWNTNPNYNRWFYFVATTPFVTVTVDRGGVKGTLQRANVAIWESDGLTEVACNRYVYNGDDVSVGYTSLTAGNTYYISVDNNYSGYRGTFTLCLDNTADYDFYEGAIQVPHMAGWCSMDAEYTTVGATPDKNAASCWNTNPNYNRWFYFVATTPFVTVTVDRGGTKGTLQRANVAIWESDGLTEVACNRYVYNGDDVSVGFITLTIGNTYYISVDNNYSGYRGTFTLCVDNGVDYDYYEGAKIILDISNWCSNNAEYTTVGATPDKNAGSCWNTNPDYNRWFAFQATNTEKVTITVLRGGVYGTIQRINAALWEADGTTQVACNRYVNNGDNVTIQAAGLTEGNWYYLSVDNNYAGYRGTFTLCFDDGRMQWTGNIDTDWDEPGNWSYAYVPTFFDDVLIPSGLTNYPETNTGNDGTANSILMEPEARLTVPTGKALTISNDFDMEADASAMSSMIDNGTLNYDGSQASYQCYLSEDQWHLVSAPVIGAQSGVFMNIYLKYFNEPDSTWNYIVPVNYDLLPGQGFSAWASSALTGSTTVTYEGGFNTGDQIPPPLTYNVGSGAGDGWNLIGNPFPSAVEWNTNWTTSNIDASIYVYDGNTGQYLTWNRNLSTGTMPNGEIPPAQGFWAKANGPSPSITIPHSERVHTSQGFYKSASNDAIQILVKGNGLSDKLLVYFNKSATAGFDSEYDAYKLRGIAEAPQIYTTVKGIDLTLNTLPAEPEMIIPMGFETGAEGDCQLIAKELGIMDDDDELYLEDKLLNEMILLTENDIYEFSASPNDDPDRFNLHFIFNDTQPVIVDDPYKVNIYSIEKEIFVRLYVPSNCKIFVYDLMGQLVAEGNGYDNSLTKIKIDSKTGIYIVKVIDNNKVYSEKVYIE